MTNDKNPNIPQNESLDHELFDTMDISDDLSVDALDIEIDGLLRPEDVQPRSTDSSPDGGNLLLPEDGQDALLTAEEFEQALEQTRELPVQQLVTDMTLDNIWSMDVPVDHRFNDDPDDSITPDQPESPFMDDEFRDTFGENGEALSAVFDAVKPSESQAAMPRDPVKDTLHHDLLDVPVVSDELLADESAACSAGLIHPGDAEVSRIMDETRSEAYDDSGDSSLDMLFDTEEASFEDASDSISEPFDYGFDTYDTPAPEDDAPFAESDEEETEQAAQLPKRRPKLKKGYGLLGIPHILSTVIWLGITVAIGLSMGRLIWLCAAEVLAFGRPDQEQIITVADGDNIDIIASKLKNAGLIKYPELFKLYADLTDAELDISAGTFTLNTKYDYHALVNAMTYHSSAREEVEVMIPEGYTCAQIFALLEEKGVCSVAELEDYAANGELDDYWFMEGVVRGERYCLEGYLFPDTYRFYTNDNPENVLEKFLDNFDNRFTDIMKEKLGTLNDRLAAVLSSRGYTEEYIEAHKITIREIVIIASMIEKETANDAESYDIASVIYNRLTNPKEYLYLNIDATIIYALGGNIDPETGMTKPLTKEDLELVSPYNTYTVPGLIPGPISNPGRNSLNAALDPSETDYYFYVYNPNTSKHIFARNAKEHDKNVEYVRSLEKQEEP